MNCRNCQAILLNYLEGALPADLGREVKNHASECPICRVELTLAQKIEDALSGQKLRMPSPDFTSRVMAALPAERAIPATLWSQIFPLVAYAVSSLGLILGLSRYGAFVSRIWDAWSERLSTLALILGLQNPETAGEPDWFDVFIQRVRDGSDDLRAFMTAYREQLYWFYTSNTLSFHVGIAALALVWLLYDYRRQRARA